MLKHVKNGASNIDNNLAKTDEDGSMRVTITWDDSKLEWLGGEVSRHTDEETNQTELYNMYLYYSLDPAHAASSPSYCSTVAMTGN